MLLDFHSDILHEQERRVSEELLDIALDKLVYIRLPIDVVLHLFIKIVEKVRKLDVPIEQCLKSLSKLTVLRISVIFLVIFPWIAS